jgi:PAS domain S-box-containing protein
LPAADGSKTLARELADLRLAVEELRRQNGQLVTTRRALEAERRRYREVFDAAPDAYLLTSLEGVITEANRAAAALLSVRQDFLIGKSLRLFIDKAEQAALEARLARWQGSSPLQTARRPAMMRGEIQLRIYKGASFPADFTIRPAYGSDDLIIGLRWILRDLSESARTEQALREREYHYRTLFDNAGDAIFIHNLTGRFLDVNRVACECLGYTREELLQMTPADINAPEMADQIPTRIAKLRHEEHIVFETICLRRDGSPIPFELNSRLIDYAGDHAVLSIARDITERKHAEAVLTRRAAQLALLSDVGRKIAAVLGLEQVLDRAAHLVQESFGYHHVALFLSDHDRDELVMRAISGDFVNLYPPQHRIKLDRGMVGWVGEHGERLWANDVQSEPHYINFYPDLIPTRSELSVPIRLGDRTVGVLDAQSPQLNGFDENDVQVMETLADQIAAAIANAQLYEAARQAPETPASSL